MNEVEHFFDAEIDRAEKRIADGNTMFFNEVLVGTIIGKELNEKHISFCERAKSELEMAVDKRNSKIEEMAEALRKSKELPQEPIKVAEMLIYATEKRENCMTGKEYDKPVFEKWQLEQIARHLLVYCNSNDDKE